MCPEEESKSGERRSQAPQNGHDQNSAGPQNLTEFSPHASDDSGRASAASSPHETRTTSPHTVSKSTTNDSTGGGDSTSGSVSNVAPSGVNGTNESSANGLERGFRLKIVAPGAEPFELIVSGAELVQEVHQVLLDRENTSHRTCFTLYLDNTPLDHFSEWKNVEGIKDDAVIRVVEDPYTLRDARIHVRHVRDLLRSLDPQDAFEGKECNSLTYAHQVASQDAARLFTAGTNPVEKGEKVDKERRHRDRMSAATIDPTPPDFLLPGAKDRPLVPLHSVHLSTGANGTPTQNGASPTEESNGAGASAAQGQYAAVPPNVQCLRNLGPSAWNPPSGNRKLKGDVMYLCVDTLEGRTYHITCCSKGFYVNQSTNECFDPRPAAQPKSLCHSLIDLMNQVSPLFKRNFATVQKRRVQRQIFERLPTPYQVHAWCAPQLDPRCADSIRAEDGTQAHRIGLEDHIPGQTRDWNEDLQMTHELPAGTLPQRLIRDRAVFKIHSDFVQAAVKGAMYVVDGNVIAINPADEPRSHMFIWNNIFFSLGFDVKDHYKSLGGDAAAFVAPANDLHGVRAYHSLDSDKLYVLGMVVVDYRGYRVTAQSIIPGILEREQEQSVVYGSVDFGKTVVASDKYAELLEPTAAQLRILPHKVKNGKEGDEAKSVTLYSSFETKGILGNDGRHYVLDLLRTFPPDVNYLPEADVTPVSKANGYPRSLPHKLPVLRHELVEAFCDYRYVMFIRIAAFHLQAIRHKAHKQQSDTATSADPGTKESEPTDDSTPAQLTNGTDEENSMDSGDEGEQIAKEIKEKMLAKAAVSKSVEPELPPEPSSEARRMVEKISPNKKPDKNSTKSALEPESEKAEDKNDEQKGQENGKQEDDSLATAEIIKRAARAVGSLSDTEFDIRFNPDCYCDIVVHDESEDLDRQRELVREAAQFLLLQQIPNFVRGCMDHTHTPLDGGSLCEAMHARGINVRYLGKIVQCLDEFDTPRLDYLKVICMTELVCRSVKHHLRTYLQSVAGFSVAAALAHYLNCLLCSCPAPQTPQVGGDELKMQLQPKKSARGRHSQQSGGAKKVQSCSLLVDGTDWLQLTPKSLWDKISAEMKDYYGYNADPASTSGIDSFVSAFGCHKMAILRRVCIMCGVQVLHRDYNMDNKSRAAFTEDDIMSLFPVSKHAAPKARDAHNFFSAGQAKIQTGQLRAAYDLIAEALNLFNSVYGAMHSEIAQCLRVLARLSYILGDPQEALANQLKACQMSERCSGLDSANTIVEYINLAHFSFANLQVAPALRLLYRARYLLLVAHGERHPIMAQIDSNIGVVLYAVQEYDLALKFLTHALQLLQHYVGKSKLKTALLYHLVARAHSCRGDFRTALRYERETYNIYKQTLGESHERTRDSGECLKHLTQQAVSFQKRMNDAWKSDAKASLAQLIPLTISPPSVHSILDVLNILNGIIFISLPSSAQDKENAESENDSGATVTEIEGKKEGSVPAAQKEQVAEPLD